MDGGALSGPDVAGAAPAEAIRFPWPPAEGEPLLAAAFETWRASLFEPAHFFAALPAGRGLGAALAYAVPVGTLGSGAALFWQTVLGLVGVPVLGPPGGTPLRAVAGFLLTPALLLIGITAYGAAVHVCLRLLGAGRAGLRATLQVLSYAVGPGVWAAVPLLGNLVGGVWSFVLAAVGLAEVHGTGRVRAALALLLPLVVVLSLLVAALALLLLTTPLPLLTS